jgi:hypothetical protein
MVGNGKYPLWRIYLTQEYKMKVSQTNLYALLDVLGVSALVGKGVFSILPEDNVTPIKGLLLTEDKDTMKALVLREHILYLVVVKGGEYQGYMAKDNKGKVVKQMYKKDYAGILKELYTLYKNNQKVN